MSYAISIDAAGSKKDNERSRDVNALFPFGDGTYRTISLITRRGGVWCNCGGTAQSVVMNVYDQLLDGTEIIKQSDTVTCKCYGTGPSAENYALTSFKNWTQAESNAAIAAWEAGTLIIRRTATIKSFTSPKHGTPAFRDGQYTDEIAISGETVPFTNYGPGIPVFDAFRSSDAINEDPESDAVYARIALQMRDTSGLSDNARLIVFYEFNRDPDEDSSYIDLTAAFGLSAGSLGEEKIVQIPGSWSNGADYYFRLYFIAGEEVASKLDTVPRASVPLFIAENNCGVAVGQYSSATEADPKFESSWPAHLYGGIRQIGNGWTELEVKSGISTPGTYGGGTLRCRKIENKCIIAGSVQLTASTDAITIADLPEGFTPASAVWALNPCSGARIAMLSTTGVTLRLQSVRNMSDGSVFSGGSIWVQCNMEYWVD